MNPFIPRNRANSLIVDGRIDRTREERLLSLGLRLIKTIECEEVQAPVAYHPDIVMHPINHNTLLIAPNVFDYYNEIFKGYDIKLIEGEKFLGYNYPDDVAYNVGRIGNYALHNFKYTDEKLIYYLKKEGLDFIDTRQGYSKCSLALVDGESAITSDRDIYKRLKERNLDVILVENGYIELEGYNYGFIGGSMGSLDGETLILNGSLDTHIDGLKMRKYINSKGIKLIELSDKEIIDIGSILGLNL